MSSPRSSTFLVLGTVVLMIGLQIVAKYLPGSNSLKREKPGVTRGDLVLIEDSLPSELAGWKRTRFTPAPPPEELPPGQYWWVHQWQYVADDKTAVVSFDQLGESQWHELTWCYRNLDWVIEDRALFVEPENGGPYAVARLRKSSGEHALLVFSVFFEDGSWAAPPDVNISLMNRANLQQPTLADKVEMKFDPLVVFADNGKAHTRALQCQCLIAGTRKFTNAEADSAVKLHLESRHLFRLLWLEHIESNSTSLRAESSTACYRSVADERGQIADRGLSLIAR